MDASVVLLFFCLLVPTVLLLKRRGSSSVPSPPLRDYLPGGRVLAALLDVRLFSRTLHDIRHSLGDIFYLWVGTKTVLVTAFPGDVKQILSATKSFRHPETMAAAFGIVVPSSLLLLPDGLHSAARTHFRNTFNHSMLADFHVKMAEAAEELCAVLTEVAKKPGQNSSYSEGVDITRITSATTFRMITEVAFGGTLSWEERLTLGRHTDAIFQELFAEARWYAVRHARTMLGVRNRLLTSVRESRAVCETFVKKRQAESEKEKEGRCRDALDAILELGGNDPVSVVSNSLLFTFAGAHTSNGTLAWSIYETCRNPVVVSEIHKELSALFGDKPLNEFIRHEDIEKLTYVRMVWKETLRMHPPGGVFERETAKDVRLEESGVEVTKGTSVIAFLHGAQMNAAIWKDPEKFNPQRWDPQHGEAHLHPPGAYLPYSLGARSCAGRFLADYEGVQIIAELHRRFEFKLAVEASEVVSCTGVVESARTSWQGSDLSSGLPVRLKLRSTNKVD